MAWIEKVGALVLPSARQVWQGVRMPWFSSSTSSLRRMAAPAVTVTLFSNRPEKARARPVFISSSRSMSWANCWVLSGLMMTTSPLAWLAPVLAS